MPAKGAYRSKPVEIECRADRRALMWSTDDVRMMTADAQRDGGRAGDGEGREVCALQWTSRRRPMGQVIDCAASQGLARDRVRNMIRAAVPRAGERIRRPQPPSLQVGVRRGDGDHPRARTPIGAEPARRDERVKTKSLQRCSEIL